VQGFPLAGTNPNSWILVDPVRGDFLIGETGAYGLLDGGVERFDPVTMTSRGWVVTEAALGGNVNVWDTGDGLKGFAVVLTPEPLTRIVAFDLLTGANLGTVASSSEYAYTHLRVDPPRRQLFVCDRTYAHPGIRIYRTTDHALLTPNPIPVGLYPYWLVDMHGPDSDVADDPGLVAPPRLAAGPRPSTGELTARFALARPGEIDLSLFDAAGRCVATLAHGARAAGGHTLAWDARALPAGAYFLRLSAPEGIAVEKVTRIR
jgi:hypothetical protein